MSSAEDFSVAKELRDRQLRNALLLGGCGDCHCGGVSTGGARVGGARRKLHSRPKSRSRSRSKSHSRPKAGGVRRPKKRSSSKKKRVSHRRGMGVTGDYFGGARRASRPRRSAAAKHNPWIAHVKAYWHAHPSLSYREAMMKARASY